MKNTPNAIAAMIADALDRRQIPASQISGQLNASQVGPVAGSISVTVTLAALTPGGTQGSMTFVNGILTAHVPAT